MKSTSLVEEGSPPEDFQTEEVPPAFHGPHSSVFSKQPPTTTLGLPAVCESPSEHKSDLQPKLNLESLTQIKLPSKIESESNQDIPINLSQSNERSMQRFKVKDQNSEPRRGVKRKSRSHSSKKRSDIKIELGTKTGCSLCQKPLQVRNHFIFLYALVFCPKFGHLPVKLRTGILIQRSSVQTAPILMDP